MRDFFTLRFYMLLLYYRDHIYPAITRVQQHESRRCGGRSQDETVVRHRLLDGYRWVGLLCFSASWSELVWIRPNLRAHRWSRFQPLHRINIQCYARDVCEQSSILCKCIGVCQGYQCWYTGFRSDAYYHCWTDIFPSRDIRQWKFCLFRNQYSEGYQQRFEGELYHLFPIPFHHDDTPKLGASNDSEKLFG